MVAVKHDPKNPHGVLVPCAECGREIRVAKADIAEGRVHPSGITCSHRCMLDHRKYEQEEGVS